MGMHKNSLEMQHIWHLGKPLGAYRLVSFLESSFHEHNMPYRL